MKLQAPWLARLELTADKQSDKHQSELATLYFT